MSTQTIGNTISDLRKAKSTTQEELAKAVGVSTQAVSKWECGGTPDTELLPPIADYFNVSIDRLFGRGVQDYGDIKCEVAKHIASLDEANRMQEAMEYCWTIQKALFGPSGGEPSVEPTLKSIHADHTGGTLHSQWLAESGITLMSLIEGLQYFVLLPEPKGGWRSGLASVEDNRKAFELLADPDVLNGLFLLHQRENKPFTPKLFEKALGMPPERAVAVLEALKWYQWISQSEIELDDTLQTVYHFLPNPAFVAMLALLKEIIRKPNSFHHSSGNRNRPYLQK